MRFKCKIYIRAPYVADFNGNTLMLHGWDKSETVIDDVTVMDCLWRRSKTL